MNQLALRYLICRKCRKKSFKESQGGLSAPKAIIDQVLPHLRMNRVNEETIMSAAKVC